MIEFLERIETLTIGSLRNARNAPMDVPRHNVEARHATSCFVYGDSAAIATITVAK